MPTWTHKDCRLPDPEVTIWRYMSLGKFLSMLDTRALFFCRLDLLEDRFEGTFPKNEPPVTPPEIRQGIRLQMRIATAVNCWHMNEHESKAMWALYVASSEGVAVRSRVRRLLRCLEESRFFIPAPTGVCVSAVYYIDHETDGSAWGVASPRPFISKGVAHAYENELRAVIWNYRQPYLEDLTPVPGVQSLGEQGGLHVNVPVEELIEAIHVAPGAPAWFTEFVGRELNRRELALPVVPSSLDRRPHV